jgi:peptidoglycan/xylan/chitin deacetylase (PgdA/CDA1 family)
MQRYLRPALIALASMLAAGSAFAQSASPQVAFTFDDLPAHGPLPPGEARPAVVKSILSTLKAEHMPPVYGFVNGYRVRDFPYQIEILRDWHDAGEPLGNHTYSHPGLDTTSAKAFIKDIAKNEAVLKKVDPDGDWHWFRYPYLDEGNTLAKRREVRAYLAANNYRVAEVTMDFEDYLWNEPYARCMARRNEKAVASLQKSYLGVASEFIDVFRGLSNQLYGHDIPYVLLMHAGAFDARMLPQLIALFRSKGFQFVTLEQAERDAAYRFDPNIGYPGGGTLQELVAKVKGVNFPDNTKPYKRLDKMCR